MEPSKSSRNYWEIRKNSEKFQEQKKSKIPRTSESFGNFREFQRSPQTFKEVLETIDKSSKIQRSPQNFRSNNETSKKCLELKKGTPEKFIENKLKRTAGNIKEVHKLSDKSSEF